jgi:hypothetical protein
MVNLKSDIIEDAYSKIRLSGLTTSPGPRENQLALRRLEMLAAILEAKGIDVDYNLEDDPDTGSESGLLLAYQDAFSSNLALKLCNDYGKEPPMMLVMEARGGMSLLYSKTITVDRVEYPTRQPIGSGNKVIGPNFFSGGETSVATGGLEMTGWLEMVSELEMT